MKRIALVVLFALSAKNAFAFGVAAHATASHAAAPHAFVHSSDGQHPSVATHVTGNELAHSTVDGARSPTWAWLPFWRVWPSSSNCKDSPDSCK